MSEHIGYVRRNDISQPIGAHFSAKGHSLSDMKMCIVEKCSYDSIMYRKTREEYFINKFHCKYEGLNRKM